MNANLTLTLTLTLTLNVLRNGELPLRADSCRVTQQLGACRTDTAISSCAFDQIRTGATTQPGFRNCGQGDVGLGGRCGADLPSFICTSLRPVGTPGNPIRCGLPT